MQTTGNVQAPGAEVTRIAASVSRQSRIGKVARATAAAAVSAVMVGVFALPAYASPTAYVPEPDIAPAQLLTTISNTSIDVPAQLPSAEEQPWLKWLPLLLSNKKSSRAATR